MSKSRAAALSMAALLLCAIAAFVTAAYLPVDHYPTRSPAGPVVIDAVAIVDPRTGTVASDQTIVIDDRRIRYAGPRAGAPIAATAQRIDGAGKYVIPGLWDSHVHTLSLSPQLHFPLLIANGVTSIRDLGDGCSWSSDVACEPESAQWLRGFEEGAVLAPRIVATASYHVEELAEEDSSAAQWEQEAGALAERLAQRGDRILKLQLDEQISADSFAAVVRAGHDRGLRVVGHLPYSVDLLDPRLAAFDSIEHDTSLLPQCSTPSPVFDGRDGSKLDLLARAAPERCASVLGAMAERKTAYTPTHIASSGQDWSMLTLDYAADSRLKYVVAPLRGLWRLYGWFAVSGVAEEDRGAVAAYHQAALSLTRRAQAAHVRVLAGTDALDAYVVHGFSLHDELEALARAGLTPAEALRAATWTPTVHFGKDSELGSIESGKLADLVLLDGNPLEDIRRTRDIHAVILNGVVYTRADLNAMLAFVERQAESFSTAAKFVSRLF